MNALVTLQTIRALTNTTHGCRRWIEESGKVWVGSFEGAQGQGGRQAVMGGVGGGEGEGEERDGEGRGGEEVEIVSKGAISLSLPPWGGRMRDWCEKDREWEGWAA